MARIDAQDIRHQAFGRWSGILAALGIPAAALTKKNKPCPCCGGTDRFSFIDQGTGRFVCRSLDSLGGDGIALVRHWLDCDFPTTLRAIAGVLGLDAGVRVDRAPTLPTTPAKAAYDRSAMIARLWAEALPIRSGDPVERYLRNRGLDLAASPAALRHHPALPYWNDGKPFGTYPAMVAKVANPAGEVVGLHRIYLTPEGRKARLIDPTTGEALDAKKLLTAREGCMRGAAIRLYEPEGNTLALAEGIETSLAVRLGSGLPCWACVSAWGLENVELPPSVIGVHVMADHDANGTGQRAAAHLAKRLLGESRSVRIHTPSVAGTDWLDVLNSNQEAAA